MAYSNPPKPLGNALKEMIRQFGWEQKLDEAAAVEAWHELAGPQINAVTKTVWIERGKLFVQITKPAWRQELHFHRTEWRNRLNVYLGKRIIKEVVFR